MTTSEKFCLRWNDFEANISGAFQEIRTEKDFFDVTLACEDDQIEAHKVILSACSPFFKGVLKKNPHQHPLLYLKGVRFSEMLSVVNFMYCGEVSVAQEDLNTFLSVAEELQVKGLTQNQNNTDRGENTGTGTAAPIRRDVKLKKPAAANCGSQESSTKSHSYRKFATAPMENEDTDDIQEMVPVKAEFTNEDDAAPADPRDIMMFNDQDETYAEAEYDEPYGSFEHQQEQFGNNLVATDDGNKALEDVLEQNMARVAGGWQCRLCTKIDTKSHIIEHLESTHLEGVEYSCQYCAVKKHSRASLRKHVKANHK